MKHWAPILIFLFTAPLLWTASPQKTSQGITEGSRVAILRHISNEFMIAKLALPGGKHGFFFHSDGRLDKWKNDAAFRIRGRAINPGSPVQITKIRFKKDRIIFEINGGGGGQKKWYQRIQVSGGAGVRRVGDESTKAPAWGANLNLLFKGPIPDLTVEELKKLLFPVLDFNRRRPTILYSPEVPKKFKVAIRNHEVLVGMSHDAVLSSKGTPDRRIRETRDGIEYEEWIYGDPPALLFVVFDGDMVIRIQQFGAVEEKKTASDPAAPPPAPEPISENSSAETALPPH